MLFDERGRLASVRVGPDGYEPGAMTADGLLGGRCFTAPALSRGLLNQQIMLLGSGELSSRIRDEIKARKDCGYTVAIEVPETVEDAYEPFLLQQGMMFFNLFVNLRPQN